MAKSQTFCPYGEEVEIHYRWHAFYGWHVRRYYGEQRRGSEVVVVEHEPGVTTAVERWMLDRATCAAMTLGEPQVSLQALMDLDRVLKDRGLRQVSSDDATVIEEACDDSTTAPRYRKTTLPAQHDVGNTELTRMNTAERQAMILRLAQLILQAGGMRIMEASDDER
ncbi:Sip1-related alpha-galactosidase [Sinorhizobium meliloti]|uniref:Sip1-related alpha-galactosidase n=1 Tax=Rhizobium meliloti TaxID=382 RepID=UPI001F1AD055|nr:Sip1-related alpha-galactosidase [Sinorhizobium meliloti]